MCTPAHSPTAKSGAKSPQHVSGIARASYRPFHDSVPWRLRVDVGYRTRRAVCTRKENESLQHGAHSGRSNNSTAIVRSSSRQAQQQWQQHAAAAAARHSGGGQLRASEPPIVRLMTPCLGGCALFLSVTCALCYLVMYLLSCVSGFTLWMCVAQGFLLLLEKTSVL